ncbi:hypothetical protein [Leucobacter sp. PH1c]|uniref:hypothetical protein n=1 Tax=Leucobacter sp. PH1c TaxID=1397278 RepID=UPI000467EEC3|nr:hypothetical protein [Leucobacter sp. PH1c]
MSAAAQHTTRERPSIRAFLRMFLAMLPFGGLATFYLLFARPAVAHAPGELAHARYGLPLTWIEQDLSRFDQGEYPLEVPFNFTRAWHDPIVTHYELFVFALNTLIVGLVITVCVLAGLSLARTLRRAPEQPERTDA